MKEMWVQGGRGSLDSGQGGGGGGRPSPGQSAVSLKARFLQQPRHRLNTHRLPWARETGKPMSLGRASLMGRSHPPWAVARLPPRLRTRTARAGPFLGLGLVVGPRGRTHLWVPTLITLRVFCWEESREVSADLGEPTRCCRPLHGAPIGCPRGPGGCGAGGAGRDLLGNLTPPTGGPISLLGDMWKGHGPFLLDSPRLRRHLHHPNPGTRGGCRGLRFSEGSKVLCGFLSCFFCLFLDRASVLPSSSRARLLRAPPFSLLPSWGLRGRGSGQSWGTPMRGSPPATAWGEDVCAALPRPWQLGSGCLGQGWPEWLARRLGHQGTPESEPLAPG